jgi:hypothetical protein
MRWHRNSEVKEFIKILALTLGALLLLGIIIALLLNQAIHSSTQ